MAQCEALARKSRKSEAVVDRLAACSPAGEAHRKVRVHKPVTATDAHWACIPVDVTPGQPLRAASADETPKRHPFSQYDDAYLNKLLEDTVCHRTKFSMGL